jgi:hypothetical protein
MASQLNKRQNIVVVVMDILLLAELTVSIYIGHGNPDTMAGIFIRAYVPALLTTVIAGRLLIRRWRTPEAAPNR